MATKQQQNKQDEQAAVVAEEFELPPGHEQQSVGFRRAFAHAKRHGNEDKAALLYAEAWAHDFEDTGADDV